MNRLPSLSQDTLSLEQAAIYQRIAGGPRGGVRGPFLALLHSPTLAEHVEQLGTFLRFQSSLPERIREIGVLQVARHWRCDYIWLAHAPLAERVGLRAQAIDQLGHGDRDCWDDPADDAASAFCRDLLRDGRVGDEVYGAAQRLLGSQTLVELTGLLGYYTLLALTLNAHEIAPPRSAAAPWSSPKAHEVEQ